MSLENEVNFGWIPTDLAHKALQAESYAFGKWMNMYFPSLYSTIGIETVEVEFPTDPKFIVWYNQGSKSACVGASWSQYMAILNLPQVGAKQYDWWTLYCEACKIDGNPNTSCARDVGTYLNYAGDILRKKGHWEVGEANPDPSDGIKEYYQARNANDGRAAFSLGRPLEFGLPWFNKWMTPVKKNGEYWIPPRDTWGSTIAGGHAIMSRFASDQRQGFLLPGTWGEKYPEVWIGYDDIDYLLGNVGGECYVAIDIESEPTPVEDNFVLQAAYNGKIYAGLMELQS